MNWKKKWKAEIDSVVPELSDSVLSSPVSVQANGSSGTLKLGKKQIIPFLAIALAALLMVSLIFTWLFGKPDPLPDNVFTIEINPAAVFVVDGDNKVKSVSSLNSDADVILSDEEILSSMIGKSAEQAANAFVERAAKCGYIDLSDLNDYNNAAAIKISSYGDYNFEAVRSSVESALSQKGIPSVVLWDKTDDKKAFNQLVGLSENEGDTVGAVKRMAKTYAEKIADDSELLTEYISKVLSELEGGQIYEAVYALIEKYMEGDVAEIESFISDLTQGLTLMQSVRELEYGFRYEIPREPIGKDDLENIHQQIKGDGSLEDFWNNRYPKSDIPQNNK